MRLDDLSEDPGLETLVMEHVPAREQPPQLLALLVGVLAYGAAHLFEALPAQVALARRVTIVNL